MLQDSFYLNINLIAVMYLGALVMMFVCFLHQDIDGQHLIFILVRAILATHVEQHQLVSYC